MGLITEQALLWHLNRERERGGWEEEEESKSSDGKIEVKALALFRTEWKTVERDRARERDQSELRYFHTQWQWATVNGAQSDTRLTSAVCGPCHCNGVLLMTALCSRSRPRIEQKETEDDEEGGQEAKWLFLPLVATASAMASLWHFHGVGGTVSPFDMGYSGLIVCTYLLKTDISWGYMQAYRLAL